MYWLSYCVASCNQYLMLINHPTDGATHGLTLRVRFLGRNLKKDYIKKKIVKQTSLIRSNMVLVKLSEKAIRFIKASYTHMNTDNYCT